MKTMARDLGYQVVVRRVAVGSAPFCWAVHNGDAFVPFHISKDRYRGMEAAFTAGQAWLANLASLTALPPERKARKSVCRDVDFKSGRLSTASSALVDDEEDEDDELELDDDAPAEYSHTSECEGLVTTSNGLPGDGKG